MRLSAIKGAREYEAALGGVRALMRREPLSKKEERRLESLVARIEPYEAAHFALPRATPAQVLEELMLARPTSRRMLDAIVGSKRVAGEILGGARIRKSVSRRLAYHFHVPADLFEATDE